MNIIRKLSVVAAALALSAICLMPVCVFADGAVTVSGPVTNDLGITTWDCIFFGRYPQGSDGNGGFVDEPIKWRVLEVEGDDAFLLADRNIDIMPMYDGNEHDKSCFWERSNLRSWLNGYDASENKKNVDYFSDNFIDRAFSEKEQAAIRVTDVITYKDSDWGYHHYDKITQDKIFLLDYQEVLNSQFIVRDGDYVAIYKNFGFTTDEGPSVTRVALNTAYTAAGGTSGSVYAKPENVKDSWLLRSPGEYDSYADFLTEDGEYDDMQVDGNAIYVAHGIRPVLHLDLTKTDVWTDAGKHTARFYQSLTVASRFEKKCGDPSFSLNAKTTGDSVLEYSSDNENAASVDAAGKVTVKGTGQAVITVTAPMTDSYEEAVKTVTVNVKKGKRDLSCKDMKLRVTDAPARLSVEGADGLKLLFASSAPDVAEVSQDGVITPKSSGQAEITVTFEGDDNYEAASASCAVTVEKADQSITVTPARKTYKAKKLRKKAAAFKAVTVKGSKGKLSYSSKASGKSKKVLKFKGGKITVKKGTKKGTYKMAVTVNAAATAEYNAFSKKVTVTVKVK